MIIREANLQDASHVVNLVQELARAEDEESPITPADVLSYLDQPGSVILLAEEDEQILGMLSCSIRHDLYHAAKTGLIEVLVITEKARGKGVGSMLLKDVLSRGIKEGWAEVSVSTMTDNHQAISFYRKHGLVDEAILLEMHIT